MFSKSDEKLCGELEFNITEKIPFLNVQFDSRKLSGKGYVLEKHC